MKSYLLVLVPALFISFTSCTKDADQSAGISDASLSSMATGDDMTLSRSTYSDEGKWEIKMNSVAAKATAEGLKNFPVNSMITKVKHDANGNVTRYAVMYKAPADLNSSDGWLWSEFDAKGHVIYSAEGKGTSCQSCHAGGTRMFQ